MSNHKLDLYYTCKELLSGEYEMADAQRVRKKVLNLVTQERCSELNKRDI